MRVPNAEHISRPWRVHEVVDGFRLEDVWELPGTGGADDFHRLVRFIASSNPLRSGSRASRALFTVRQKLGELFGWDDAGDGVGSRVASLRERLPDDLRAGPAGPAFEAVPFTSLYLTEDEWAAEAANRTVHGVLHLARIPEGQGRYRVQLAVYVRPNGFLGRFYMAAIKPFRHLVVYPALMRQLGRTWQSASST